MTELRGFRAVTGNHPVLIFALLAIGLGWAVALPLLVSPGLPEEWIMLIATTPTIAALATQWLASGNFRICSVGRPWRRALLGAAAGVALVLAAFAVVPALVLTNGAATRLHWDAILAGLASYASNPFNLLGGPLNEEPGWRGFALPRLQARYGPLPGSLVLGGLWFLWHGPLFLVSGWLSVPLWVFAILILSMSVLMTFGANLSGGGIFTAVVMHAVFNSSFPILVGLCRDLPTREPGIVYYVVGVGIAAVVVIALTRGRLGYGTAPR